jgi:hypothetical protein
MSQAYARRATGDYLWQIDYDEFYHPGDMTTILELMASRANVKAASVRTVPFWGGIEYVTDGLYLRNGIRDCPRVFKWKPGYRYVNHRPVTIVDERGEDVGAAVTLSADELATKGIFLYHYSFVLPSQVVQKREYYCGLAGLRNELPRVSRRRRQWTENYFSLKRPFFIDDTSITTGPSWLQRFRGQHPPMIERLWADVVEQRLPVERRDVADIETLLDSGWYRTASLFLDIFHRPLMFLCRLRDAVIYRIERARARAPLTQTPI